MATRMDQQPRDVNQRAEQRLAQRRKRNSDSVYVHKLRVAGKTMPLQATPRDIWRERGY